MHDLHLANKVHKLILEQARENHLHSVKRIAIELGVISEHGADITSENLEFNLNLLNQGTIADGAEIIIKKIKGNSWNLLEISGK